MNFQFEFKFKFQCDIYVKIFIWREREREREQTEKEYLSWMSETKEEEKKDPIKNEFHAKQLIKGITLSTKY